MSDYNFVASLAKKLDVTQVEVKRFLDGFKEELGSAVKKGESVRLSDFGTFKQKQNKARTIMNIHTKKPMTIPASKSVGFSMSSKLKEVMNG